MWDVFRVGIKQKYWLAFVNTHETWDVILWLFKEMQEQLVSVPVHCLFTLSVVWVSSNILSWITPWLFVKYMTAAVDFLSAHASGQDLGRQQQALIGSHTWILLGYLSASQSTATGVWTYVMSEAEGLWHMLLVTIFCYKHFRFSFFPGCSSWLAKQTHRRRNSQA